MPLNQQDKKEITLLGGMIDPDYQDEIEFLLHKEEYVYSTEDILGHLLVLRCSATKVNGKLHQLNPG